MQVIAVWNRIIHAAVLVGGLAAAWFLLHSWPLEASPIIVTLAGILVVTMIAMGWAGTFGRFGQPSTVPMRSVERAALLLKARRVGVWVLRVMLVVAVWNLVRERDHGLTALAGTGFTAFIWMGFEIAEWRDRRRKSSD